MQAYSNPNRETDPHALPDVEVFYHEHAKRDKYGECIVNDEGDCVGTGWFWQSCFPGCLPDGDPIGPFDTEAKAIADAQSEND